MMSVELISVRYFSDGENSDPSLPIGYSRENLIQEDTSNSNTENGQNTKSGRSSVKTSVVYIGLRRLLHCCNYREAFNLSWSCAALSAIILLVVSAMSISLLIFYTSIENEHLNMVSTATYQE